MATSVRGKTILQVIPALHTGGAERTTIDIAAAIVASGANAIVASQGGRLVGELEAVGARHVTMPVGRKNPLAFWHNGRAIARLVRTEGVDLVHARSRAPAWAAFLATRRTGTPFVTTYHGAYTQKSRLKAIYNGVMAKGDVVIANSAFTADLIRRRHPSATDRIVVIHRGTDLAAFIDVDVAERANALRQRWNVPPQARVVLQVARLTPWKGQRVLIDALCRLARQEPEGWVAILAGDDQGRTDYRRELEQRIGRAGLGDRIRLVGHVDDVPAAMAAASVVVVASTEPEAFGRAAVEAQVAGVPVIVSDLGAVRETVLAPPEVDPADRTGWRFPASDDVALARTLHEVLAASAHLSGGIGARGRSHAVRHFSVAAMQARTLEVYAALLKL